MSSKNIISINEIRADTGSCTQTNSNTFPLAYALQLSASYFLKHMGMKESLALAQTKQTAEWRESHDHPCVSMPLNTFLIKATINAASPVLGQSYFIKFNGQAPNVFVLLSLWRTGYISGQVSFPASLLSMDQNYHVNNDITVISIFYVLKSL